MNTTTAALSVEAIARICHEANKAYCFTIGDTSQKSWEEAEQWQRESAIKGVQFRLDNPDAPQSAQHEAWMKDKLADGWKWGAEKNPETKEHPCIVDYLELPEEQRLKDALFQAVVDSLTGIKSEILSKKTRKKLAWLQSLEQAGVDNWEGHDHAVDILEENYPEFKEA